MVCSWDWTEGLDLHGVDPEEFVRRWNELVGYGRKEIFLRCELQGGNLIWRHAMNLDLPELRYPEQAYVAPIHVMQGIVDVLARHGEIAGLHYAAEYNTTPP